MSAKQISEEINRGRRRFVGTTAAAIAVTQFGVLGSVSAETGKAMQADAASMEPGTNASFGPLQQINAGLLNVGYASLEKLRRPLPKL